MSEDNINMVYPLDIFIELNKLDFDVPNDLVQYISKMSQLDKIYKVTLKLWRKDASIYSNNWLNTKKQSKTEDEELYYNIRIILNKMSESNFNILYEEFMKFDIKNKEQLNNIIEMIYKKAILEKTFSSLYANLIYKLLPTYVLDDNKQVFFNNQMMEVFQKKFLELMLKEEDDFKDPYKKKQYIGFITLLGELYNQGGLDEQIICYCLKFLLNSINDNNSHYITLFCIFIEKIGHKLKEKNEVQFNIYFNNIKELLKNKSINIKYKFPIQDLIDINKKNNWKI
jgi:hypothetical protein